MIHRKYGQCIRINVLRNEENDCMKVFLVQDLSITANPPCVSITGRVFIELEAKNVNEFRRIQSVERFNAILISVLHIHSQYLKRALQFHKALCVIFFFGFLRNLVGVWLICNLPLSSTGTSLLYHRLHHCHTPLRLLSFVDVTGHSCGLHDSSDCAALPLIIL